jgi:hypothetical protein
VSIRAFSFGCGVQSVAALVLAARGDIDYPLFLFANVGSDSENLGTLRYLTRFAIPFAADHGIELVELHKLRRNGQRVTLLERIRESGSSVPIPMRMSNGAPGNRQCTGDFKIAVVAKELKRRGASRSDPAVVGLGISLDEYQRARSDSRVAHEVLEYPLLDLRLTRSDCVALIGQAGLPVPPKSACWFCPFQSPASFQRMRHDDLPLYTEVVSLERMMIDRRARLGKDAVFMTRFGRPLDQVTSDQMTLDLADWDGECDGVCGL